MFGEGILTGPDKAQASYSGARGGLFPDYTEDFTRRTVCACGEVFSASEPGQKKCSPYCLGTRGVKGTDFGKIKNILKKEGEQD